MPTTWGAIFLGNSDTFMDPYEGDNHSENAGSFVGNSYGNDDDPLSKHIVEIQTNDTDASNTSSGGSRWGSRYRYRDSNEGEKGSLDVDNSNSEDTLTYDLGNGEQTHTMDGVATYKATLTYEDGSQVNFTAAVMQDTDGNLFLLPDKSSGGSNTDIFEAKAIGSIKLNSLHEDTYSGVTADRVDTEFVCFARGSQIDTPDGPRPVEDLCEGDLVTTLDHGAQPIVWKGGRKVLARGPARAYRVKAGVFGDGLPSGDLVLSAQHRVMLRSPVAARMVGSSEVLVAITKLDALPGVTLADDLSEIEYHHFLCAGHELVRANGSWCETLLPGPQAIEILGPNAIDEIEARMPDWRDMQPARLILDGHRSRKLADRHHRNDMPVVQDKTARSISKAEPRRA